MTTAFVLGGGGLLGALEVGMLGGRAGGGGRAGRGGGALDRRDQRRVRGRRPAGRGGPAEPDVAGRGYAAGVQREAVGPGGSAGAVGYAPALVRGAGPAAGRRAAGPGLRRSQAAVPVRGGRDREGDRALVLQRAGGG